MKNKLKIWIQGVLGITDLTKENSELKKRNEQLSNKVESLSGLCFRVSRDYDDIRKHISLINKDFTVIADVNIKEPTVVLVMRRFRGSENIVKTYTFQDKPMEEIFKFIECFGQEQCRIDSPVRMRGPRFRW